MHSQLTPISHVLYFQAHSTLLALFNSLLFNTWNVFKRLKRLLSTFLANKFNKLKPPLSKCPLASSSVSTSSYKENAVDTKTFYFTHSFNASCSIKWFLVTFLRYAKKLYWWEKYNKMVKREIVSLSPSFFYRERHTHTSIKWASACSRMLLVGWQKEWTWSWVIIMTEHTWASSWFSRQ